MSVLPSAQKLILILEYLSLTLLLVQSNMLFTASNKTRYLILW